MKTSRSIAMATEGMVASPHYFASLAGLRVLQDGGSAVDAAIAVNATLGIVYPHMSGMGGDSFWLINDAENNKVHALNGSGRAVKSATRERYKKLGLSVIPQRGPHAALTVPGTVDAWCMAHERFGKLPMAKCLEQAIKYARDGYPVSAGQAIFTRNTAKILGRYATASEVFMPNGRPPEAGDIMRFPGMANVMEAIAREGRAGFYEGEVRDEIVASLAAAGGEWEASDLTDHRGAWSEPVSTTYRGYTCYQHPPNSQGFAHLMVLNILERFDVAALKNDRAAYIHLLVEATKLAFRDRDRYLTCADAGHIPLDRLLSKEYAAELAKQISFDTTIENQPEPMGQDTTCTVVVDRHGNAASVIQSLYHEFGSAFVAGKTGILLQNRGSFFSLDEQHVNTLMPGKRCFHTLMPGMLFRNGKPELVYGTMGGEGQPQTSTALVTRYVDFNHDVQTAIDNPRWLYGRTWGDATQTLRIENRFAEEVYAGLRARGHQIEITEAWSDFMGHAAAIRIDPQTGLLSGAADPRGEGIAVGW
ncbi:gamma-glutamyltransferase [Massilia sp. GCM10023247]|uniref:gamma-glutamyltransferase n=1 Tax=Massilia sp. GCM10023247 TaxID=3252643 RepID=UPI003615D557